MVFEMAVHNDSIHCIQAEQANSFLLVGRNMNFVTRLTQPLDERPGTTGMVVDIECFPVLAMATLLFTLSPLTCDARLVRRGHHGHFFISASAIYR
jgi:hypothetical protein